jgi:hypothetical protein
MTDQGSRVVQEQVGGKEDLKPDNTHSALNAVLNAINNKFEHECLDEAVKLQNTYPIHQSIPHCIPGHKDSIPGLLITSFPVHQVGAIWILVRRFVLKSDVPGALVADEMCISKTFTSVAAAMVCKLLTEKVIMRFLK